MVTESARSPNLDRAAIDRLVSAAFPGREVSHVAPFAEGASNDTWKVTLAAPVDVVVLRLFRSEASLRAEVAALSAVRDHIPAPALLHVGDGRNGMPPFIVLEYIEGVSFRQFRRSARDDGSISDVAHQIGRILAEIHLRVPTAAGDSRKHPDPRELPSIMDRLCTSAVLHGRLEAESRRRAQSLVAFQHRALEQLSEHPCFVHGDFNNRNVLVRSREGRWQVAGVVDWECAGLGVPLYDIARFLQYESPAAPSREPSFSRGYLEAGGRLPERWWWLTRVINLVSQCQLLTEPELLQEIVDEVVGLIRRTIAESENVAVACG